MMFFFKRQKIVVDCFTEYAPVKDLFPIKKASHFYPDWWKQLPKTYSTKTDYNITINVPTMKSCLGFLNLYQNGFVIPLWSSLIIENDEQSCRYQFSQESATSIIIDHNSQQYNGACTDMKHMKIISPWLLKEKSGVNFVWIEPTWNDINLFHNVNVVPAILDFKYQCGANINLFVPNVNLRLEIKAGHPMAHLIPMSDKEVEIRTHLISREEYFKINSVSYESSFQQKYKTNKKIMQANEKKCPFGFGK